MISDLDVIDFICKWTNVMTVEDNLALQLVPILFDMVMLNHNDYHIHLIQELVEVQNLILHDFFVSKEGIKRLQRASEMALLSLQHLEGGAFTHVIDVLLIGESVQTDFPVIRDAILFHNLIDAVENEGGLTVVGLHGLVNHLSELRIITYQEPRVNTDAVATHTGAGLKNIHARMHVTNLDYLIDIHIVVTADTGQLVGKGNINGTEGVLNDLGHLSGADVGNDNLSLTEGGIILLDLLTNGLVVSTNGAVVMEQLIDHVAGDDALGGMNKVDVLANLKAVGLHNRTDKLIHRAGRDGGFNNNSSALGAHLHHFLDGSHHVAGIYLLTELVIRSRNTDNVQVCLLVLSGELDSSLYSGLEEFIKTVFLESGLTCIKSIYQLLVIICTNDPYTM